jgi:thioredoxin-like negative regulator of GroEL
VVRQLTGNEYESLVKERFTAAIHFDAAWDVKCRPITRQKMQDADAALSQNVNLGEVDCDQEISLAQSIRLLNVPAVAYYRDGKLIAVLPGVQQEHVDD